MEQNRINQRNSTTVVYFLVRLAGSSPHNLGGEFFSQPRVGADRLPVAPLLFLLYDTIRYTSNHLAQPTSRPSTISQPHVSQFHRAATGKEHLAFEEEPLARLNEERAARLLDGDSRALRRVSQSERKRQTA